MLTLGNSNKIIFIFLYKLKNKTIRKLEIKCDIAAILNLGF